MTEARVRATSVEGFDALVLENQFVRATVIPTLGGRVWELEDRLRARQWIWHRERVALAPPPPTASYDDVWAGGWEELFPNDAPGRFEGRDLPDHGEWWALSWSVERTEQGETALVRLSTRARVVNAVCVKEFRLPAGAATLSVTYRIRSAEPAPFHYLFKQHLPIQVTPACRLVLPGGRVHAVDQAFGTLMPGPGPLDWPVDCTGRGVNDLREVPPRSTAHREFVYVSDLPAAWCGIDDRQTGASLRMAYDRRVFPFVWLFLSYGGWRDTYTAVLEPCTNMPKDLAEAVRLGQSARLQPQEELVTTVTVSVAAMEGRSE